MTEVSVESVSRLIGQIYDAAYGRSSLGAAVRALSRTFGGSRACLLRMGAGEDGFQAVASIENDIEDFIRLGPEILCNDRLLRAMQFLPVGNVVPRSQMVDETVFRRGEVWQVFFRPREMEIGLSCKLRSSGETSWFVDLQRSESQGPLSEAELALFRQVVPHLERATAIGDRLNGAIGMTEALSHLALGVFLVDGGCRILQMNGAAEALLRAADGPLRGTRGELVAASAKDAVMLKRLVAGCCAQAADALPSAGGSMLAGVDAWGGQSARLILSVSSYLGANPFDLGVGRRAVILAREVSMGAKGHTEALRTLFGLTPAEAKIAGSLASGLTLKQAAEKSAIRINTARWYLDEIFRKTNTNRQSQLVGLLAHMPALRSQ